MKRLLPVAAMVLAGCAAQSPQPASTWQPATDSYVYVLTSSCGEQLLHGTMRITVHNGQVTKAEGLDDPGTTTVNAAKPTSLPTLKDLVEQYESARSRGAAVAEITYSPDGTPQAINIDGDRNAIDDELCYKISGYQQGAG